MAGQIRIGTSGWDYGHWKEVFYPPKLPTDRWFEHYCQEFGTVEINHTFYQQPEDCSFERWQAQAPEGFLYAVKANRFLTHLKKLNNPEEPLQQFLSGARLLEPHLGPLLFQLPPHWKKNVQRLRYFCHLLPQDLPHVVEFRDPDWLAEDVYKVLREHQVALCVHDMIPRHPRCVTGQIVYLRFHGTGDGGRGKYAPEQLQPWAEWIAEVADRRDVYAYFNNDAHGYALEDARTLRNQIEELRG